VFFVFVSFPLLVIPFPFFPPYTLLYLNQPNDLFFHQVQKQEETEISKKRKKKA